ncbi:MAG: diacylglycerol kinase family protein [Anaerolineae bacterium]|jgi:diacylglycerol kinase (ATP)|nr:diacylglycerol kinase family protein [Anaerolineae bacterium]
MMKRMYDHLTATARINPEDYAARVSKNRALSLSYALRGWLYMLVRQKNTRLMSAASLLALGLALWLQLPPVELALIVVVITIIWLTEFLNAGIEAAIDVAAPEYHPMAQVGKDVASAAVLLGVVAAVIVAVLLLLPPLLRRLGL